ncbi:unnamed protein product [Amoebophrya sp. A120]|nr:unnamed protein product [Amoebophrya sp. A120]|eukprot:GSA120T00016025001.1
MKINLDRIPVFLGFLALGILLTTALMQCLDWSYGQAGPLGFFLVVQLQKMMNNFSDKMKEMEKGTASSGAGAGKNTAGNVKAVAPSTPPGGNKTGTSKKDK